jgi:hypothetical protein
LARLALGAAVATADDESFDEICDMIGMTTDPAYAE